MKTMAKLVKFDQFTDSLYSNLKFEQTENGNNSEKYNRILRIINKIIENELTKRQKICLNLYYNKHMNMIKISKHLKIYPSTVHRHIKRAKTKIKNIIKYNLLC